MKRTLGVLGFAALVMVHCGNLAWANAASLSRQERIERMDREMACIAQAQKASAGVSWENVCYTDYTAPDDDVFLDNIDNEEAQAVHTTGMPQVEQEAKERISQVEEMFEDQPQDIPVARPAYATPARVYNKIPKPSTHTFEVGPEVVALQYKKPTVGVKERGTLNGLYANYTYRADTEGPINVLHADTHFDYGKMVYRGAGVVGDIDNYLAEARLWAGKDVNLSSYVRLTPYMGVGYRWWYDDAGGRTSTTGSVTVDRQSQYVYVPFGMQWALDTDSWQVGLETEYDLLVRGWQDTYVSNIDGFPDIRNTQKSGYGLRGALNLKKKTESLNFVVAPYLRYWEIAESDTVTKTAGLGPYTRTEYANRSIEAGARFGVEF